MNISVLLIIVLLILCVGGLPRWGYSASWGYGPSGLLGLLFIVLLILLLTGRH